MTERFDGVERLVWHTAEAPTQDGVARCLRAEGVSPSAWSSPAGDRYAAHEHGYTKLLMCAAGSITFFVGADEDPIELHPGEGFILAAGTTHAALVGADGCTCLEGHR